MMASLICLSCGDTQAEERGVCVCSSLLTPLSHCFFYYTQYPGSWGHPKHVAVHSLSLAIPCNECFGLLGPNGTL